MSDLSTHSIRGFSHVVRHGRLHLSTCLLGHDLDVHDLLDAARRLDDEEELLFLLEQRTDFAGELRSAGRCRVHHVGQLEIGARVAGSSEDGHEAVIVDIPADGIVWNARGSQREAKASRCDGAHAQAIATPAQAIATPSVSKYSVNRVGLTQKHKSRAA